MQYILYTYLIASVNILVLLCVLSAHQPSRFCRKLLQSPNFHVDHVVGRPWRVYFSWVMDSGERCVELSFKKLNRTSAIKRRFASNMDRYMADQVMWEDATLLLSKYPLISKEDEVATEMLLFPKEQKGSFDGIHDFTEHYAGHLPRHSVPLEQLPRLALKLFRKGKYLVMAECRSGISYLMARPNETVYRLEILSLAGEIWPDESGYTTCSSHKFNKGIEGILIDDN